MRLENRKPTLTERIVAGRRRDLLRLRAELAKAEADVENGRFESFDGEDDLAAFFKAL